MNCCMILSVHISEELNLNEAPTNNTRSLRRTIEGHFAPKISFTMVSKYSLVCVTNTNPCDCVIAALVGHGLRDDDIIKSFTTMIKRKDEKKLPLTPDELLEGLDTGPVQDLYNTLFLTLHNSGIKNMVNDE